MGSSVSVVIVNRRHIDSVVCAIMHNFSQLETVLLPMAGFTTEGTEFFREIRIRAFHAVVIIRVIRSP